MSELWSAEVAAAVSQHMNDDHAADCLLIVRTLADRPDATAARMTGMDPDGLVFGVRTPEGDREVVVPWPERPVSRAEVRTQVVVLHRRAAAAARHLPRDAAKGTGVADALPGTAGPSRGGPLSG